MKGDAVFVNIGRGDTVDQEKLVEALQAEKGDEEVGATGSLRIGGASLECVFSSLDAMELMPCRQRYRPRTAAGSPRPLHAAQRYHHASLLGAFHRAFSFLPFPVL